MRILVVGAVNGATVDIGESLARAFNSLKEPCYFLNFSEYNGELQAIKRERDVNRTKGFLIKLQKRLLEEVENFHPTLVIGIAQSPLNNLNVLDTLRKSGIRLGYWFLEDFQVFHYWREIAPKFDYFFTIQKSKIFNELKKIGCDSGYYLPAAFDDLLELNDQRHQRKGKKAKVTFVGAPYNNRVEIFNAIQIPGLEIYGEGWEGLHAAVRLGSRRISPSERRYIYANSEINLNLHSSVNSGDEWLGDFVNPRTFEIAGMGGFQLVDLRELLPLHFEIKCDIFAFQNIAGMLDGVNYYLKNEMERKEMAENARVRVLKEHTYRHRAMEILSLFI